MASLEQTLTSPASGGDEQTPPSPPSGETRTIRRCDFGAAGRLTNEVARSLTSLYETFAANLSGALGGLLGAATKVTLENLDQQPVKDHLAALPALSFVTSFTEKSGSSVMLLECDIDLVFSVIDLMLGGSGTPAKEPGELSEIEAEIMQDLAALIARQLEAAWALPNDSLPQNPPMKSSALQDLYQETEKVAVTRFHVEIGSFAGWIQLVLPSSFINLRLKQSKLDQPKKKGRVSYFPTLSLRERVLECEVAVAAELPPIRISVKELVKLELGGVLKLRTPVRTPGMLTVEGRAIYEILPVRNGAQKAAHLCLKVQPSHPAEE